MRACVTVSRKWNNPKITTTVDAEGITLKIDLADFVEAVKREIGPITLVFKQDTFFGLMDSAIEKVIAGIKDESAKVV